jgi:hypothetical protein
MKTKEQQIWEFLIRPSSKIPAEDRSAFAWCMKEYHVSQTQDYEKASAWRDLEKKHETGRTATDRIMNAVRQANRDMRQSGASKHMCEHCGLPQTDKRVNCINCGLKRT